MFKGLFGAGKKDDAKSSATAAQKTIDSISNLTQQEEQLYKRKQLLESRVEQELAKAKEFTRKKQQKQALLCLKKKKMYEQQIEQIENMILRVSEQRMLVENSRTTADVLKTMKEGAQASKQTMQEVKIEKVDQVMDEINEQNEEMRAIQEALGQPVGMAADLDDFELEDELKNMEEELLQEQLLEPAPVPVTRVHGDALPNAPKKEVTASTTTATQKTQEELELEELEKEMGLAA
eukprot:TRINITY_DN40788_c0_g1_i2.p2 TRINITY_DN40788_c0_g1~~TRINITY_DN40788_c0_g1_i2.p2  ORF type:complete len:236 (+),score=54.42 TRINITY_DN40788_c0_g1_i2:158-865(+)